MTSYHGTLQSLPSNTLFAVSKGCPGICEKDGTQHYYAQSSETLQRDNYAHGKWCSISDPERCSFDPSKEKTTSYIGFSESVLYPKENPFETLSRFGTCTFEKVVSHSSDSRRNQNGERRVNPPKIRKDCVFTRKGWGQSRHDLSSEVD